MQPDDGTGELSEETKRRLLRVFERVNLWRDIALTTEFTIAAGGVR